jgi:hypothetical protein
MNDEMTRAHPARAGRVPCGSIRHAKACATKKTIAIGFGMIAIVLRILARDLEVVARAKILLRVLAGSSRTRKCWGASAPDGPGRSLGRHVRPKGPSSSILWRRDAIRDCRDLIKCGRERAPVDHDSVAGGRDSILDAPMPPRANALSPETLANASEVLARAQRARHSGRERTRSHLGSTPSQPGRKRSHFGTTRSHPGTNPHPLGRRTAVPPYRRTALPPYRPTDRPLFRTLFETLTHSSIPETPVRRTGRAVPAVTLRLEPFNEVSDADQALRELP